MRAVFAFLILLSSMSLISGQEMKIMTYNIRYDNPDDGIHNWHQRKEEMANFLVEQAAHIIGVQEALHHQLEFLEKTLPGHLRLGVGRKDGRQAGEYAALFIDTSVFTVVKHGTFWLSSTPDQVSVGWDAALPRICTWAHVVIKSSGKQLTALNTHFDHRGTKARRKATRLIYRKMQQLSGGGPALLMGDLNLDPSTRSIRFLQRQLMDPISRLSSASPVGTSCGFDQNEPNGKRIDYIFFKDFDVRIYNHLDPRVSAGHHLSDHLPVVAEATLK